MVRILMFLFFHPHPVPPPSRGRVFGFSSPLKGEGIWLFPSLEGKAVYDFILLPLPRLRGRV